MKQVASLRNEQANCPSTLLKNIPTGKRGRYQNGAVHADENWWTGQICGIREKKEMQTDNRGKFLPEK